MPEMGFFDNARAVGKSHASRSQIGSGGDEWLYLVIELST